MTETARLVLAVDSTQVDSGQRHLDRLGRQAELTEGKVTRATDQMTGGLKLLGAALATVATSQFFRSILQGTASFEQGMKNVGAVSGATAEELDQLAESALRAAASTRFNPAQTTEALYALASSGQSATEQMASLDNVLNLAEAGQAELGRATELVTSTLNQFELAASDSGRVVDVYTASIGASALNVDRLQVAMRNAGPTAAALDQSLEATTATLGLLTTAFGNGERAGTGLRAIFNELPEKASDLGVSVRDAAGNFRPLVDIIADLEAQGVTASKAVSVFGAEAGPALAALLSNGSDALRTMESRLASTGQAAATASDQLDTLQGDIDSFFSAVDVAFIGIGDSQAGLMRSATQTATNLVRLWSGYGDTLGDAQESTEQLSAVIEGLAVLVAGRATAAIASYAAAKGRSVVASIADAKAEATATAAIARRTEAELIAARTIQQRAIADAKATAGTNAHAFAMDNLTKATARASSAQAAHAAAANAAAAASSRASVAARAASGAMGLLGGPVGVVTTAVLALGYFATSAGEAEEKAVDLDSEIDKLAGSFERLTSAQAKKKLMDLEQPFEDLQDEAIRLYNSIQSYQLLLDRNPEDRSAENWKKRLIELRAELDTVQQKAEDYRSTFSRLFEIAEGGPSSRPSEDKPAGNSGGGNEAAKTIQKRIEALRLEAETLGMTASEADLYKLKIDGATQSQLRAAEQAYLTIDAYEAEKEAIERNLGSRRAAAEIIAEMEADRQKKIDRGEQLLEQYMTEEELLRLHHERNLEILNEAREKEFDNEARWNAAVEAENKRFNDAMEGMDRARWIAQASLAASGLSEITGLMSSENRKMFEIGKAAAIAQTLVSIPASAQKAYDAMAGIPFVGPALGAAAAAAAIIAGGARLQAIKSAQFGSGGSASGGGGGGISGGVQTVPAAPAPVQLDGGGGGSGVTINFQGPVTGLDEESLTETLVGKLGERINDLDYVLINRSSRQGRELAGN
ncbi:phage tail tape measure protein [Alcanivorax sp.]|uniref:phage tail tape measure protein n=1 Tax=Alcanivorax sp. TaxID=1872427 RepID=UPI003BA8BB24